jgi:hypothetical protein
MCNQVSKATNYRKLPISIFTTSSEGYEVAPITSTGLRQRSSLFPCKHRSITAPDILTKLTLKIEALPCLAGLTILVALLSNNPRQELVP